MKRSAPSTGAQWNLPLIDTAALALPERTELARALMDLLIQVARQIPPAPSRPQQEAPYAGEADF